MTPRAIIGQPLNGFGSWAAAWEGDTADVIDAESPDAAAKQFLRLNGIEPAAVSWELRQIPGSRCFSMEVPNEWGRQRQASGSLTARQMLCPSCKGVKKITLLSSIVPCADCGESGFVPRA